MKIKTCSRDEKVRYLYVGIGLILRNIWVLLHEELFGLKQKGAKNISLRMEIFSVERMKSWLRNALEEDYGRHNEISLPFSFSNEKNSSSRKSSPFLMNFFLP